MQEAKRILRYVNGTKEYVVLYSETDDFKLIGYTDSDWDRSVDDKKTTSRYVFHLGLGGHFMGFQEAANNLIINNRS